MKPENGRRVSFLLVFVSIMVIALFFSTAGETIEVTKGDSGISSIQKAVEKAKPGDTLLVGSGDFKENVSVDKDLTIKAQSQGEVSISGKEEGKPVLKVGPSESSVTIKGLVVEDAKGKLCKTRSRGICPDGLLAAGKSSVRIENSSFESNGKNGIRSIGTAGVTIEDSKVRENQHAGFWVTESAEVRVNNVRISGHRNGIYLDQSARMVLSDSEVLSSSIYGINLFGKSRITVENSLVTKNGQGGLRFENSSHGNVRNTSINKNDGTGVLIQSSATVTFERSEVRKNDIGITNHSEETVDFSENEISGNSVDLVGDLSGDLREKLNPEREEEITLPDENYSDLQSAVDALEAGGTIYLDGRISGHVVIDKEINIEAVEGRPEINPENTIAPVLSLVSEAEVKVEGIKIVDSGGTGVVLGGNARMRACQSTIEGSSEEGAGLWDSAELVLERSEVKNNGASGLRLVDSAQLEVRSSLVSGNQVANVLLAGSSSADIEFTEISGSGGSGLRLADSSRGTLRNNDISNNEENGVALHSSPRVEITGNRITNNVSGVSLRGASVLVAEKNAFRGNSTGIKVMNSEEFKGRIDGAENAFSKNESDFAGVKESIKNKLTE
ncbi:right-handed parallel beta-helix repeat-containing protein [Candidatus Bipolaricaulota bacterium]|nr:right-handed parallel beta-helix repeat-containing protein [Candidatus Bipolaricaulota bacterium]